MRLDHLLSREPILGDARLAGLVGCVFLVPALSHYCLGGGCGCVIGLGINVMQEASMLSGSRSTPVGRVAHNCWHQGLFGVGGCVVCCL